jgi:hypothetical protein
VTYDHPLSVGWIWRTALRTYRDRWWRVSVVATAVAMLSTATDALADVGVDELDGRGRTFLGVLLGATGILLTGANSVGSTLLAGVLDRTVAEHQHGHEPLTLRDVVHGLPWVALIVADLLVGFVRALGFLLLIVPGIVAVTLTAIVGPVVINEHCGPVRAIRRSAQLVWSRFWIVLLAVTIPLLLESGLSEGLEHLPGLHGFWQHLAVVLLVEVPFATAVALTEVTVAFQLFERSSPGSVTRHARQCAE